MPGDVNDLMVDAADYSWGIEAVDVTDLNPAGSPRGTHDWSVLNDPEVEDVIRATAARVGYSYRVDEDDLYQEGVLLVSANWSDLFVHATQQQYGLLSHALERDLINGISTEIRRRNVQTSLDLTLEYDSEPMGDVSERLPADGDYPVKLIEALIPAIWDDSYCFGMQQEGAPDSDMPRGSSNKAQGNVLWAHIADIRQAWKYANLSVDEKSVLVLYYGQGYKQSEIASIANITQQAVSNRISDALVRLHEYLNGVTEKSV